MGQVSDALDGMSCGKLPGSDGLPAEFYQKCWRVVGADLVEVFNYAFNTGQLSLSQRTGQITLLHKNGDRLDRRNWRPITLLNADYKLCECALAACLLKVLHDVVHPDQTCGVLGRYVGENIALLRDVVSFADDVGCPAAILSLDQEKAFDRVDWPFLFPLKGKLSFGPSFVRWVRLLYTNIRSFVLVNGFASPPFFSVALGVAGVSPVPTTVHFDHGGPGGQHACSSGYCGARHPGCRRSTVGAILVCG